MKRPQKLKKKRTAGETKFSTLAPFHHMSCTKTSRATKLVFILDLEALHLLPITKEWNTRRPKTLLPAFLGNRLPWFRLSTFSSGASLAAWSASGSSRHMMPRNQSREPNSRDSEISSMINFNQDGQKSWWHHENHPHNYDNALVTCQFSTNSIATTSTSNTNITWLYKLPYQCILNILAEQHRFPNMVLLNITTKSVILSAALCNLTWLQV